MLSYGYWKTLKLVIDEKSSRKHVGFMSNYLSSLHTMISYRNHMTCGLMCRAFFIDHNIFRVHLCCSMCSLFFIVE